MQRLKQILARISLARFLRILGQLLFIIFLFYGIQIWQTRKMPETGRTHPPLILKNSAGKTFDLQDYRGKKVALYFFAPWCTVCKLSISNFISLADNENSSGFTNTHLLLIGLDYDDPDEIKNFMRDYETRIPVLYGDSTTARQWQISGFPSIFIINEDGDIRYKGIGYSTWLGLRFNLLLH